MREPRELLADLSGLAEAATPGPWERRVAPNPESGESKAEWVAGTCVSDEPLQILMSKSSDPKYAYLVPALTGDGPTSAVNAEFIAAARTTVPRLVAALTAVLDLHPRSDVGQCRVCVDEADNPQGWPCETVAAITAALEGGSS